MRKMVMVALLVGALAIPLAGQSTGSISGTVVLAEGGNPLHGASLLLLEHGRTTVTDPDGTYSFDGLPPGTYHVHAHMHSLFTDDEQVVQVTAGEEATLDFRLAITAVKEEITVTGSAKPELAFDSISSVDTYDAVDLSTLSNISLGEALEHQVGTGIAKRGFGPGPARPIVRGFDGDRVLIMEDGIRTGTLSSQSGDHGEIIDIGLAHRLEVVKGPAALLYSGNAVGGAVNVIDRHREQYAHPHEGLRGYIGGAGGTTNSLARGSAGFEYGIGRWMLWGDAGAMRSSDYNSPEGTIYNSRSRMNNGSGGFGWFGTKAHFSVDAKVGRSLFGVPFAQDFHGHGHEEEGHDEDEDHEEGEEGEDHEEGEEDEDHDEDEHGEEEELERVSLDSIRRSYRVDWGLHQLSGPVSDFSVKLNYVQWKHDEIEGFADGEEEVATTFRNNQFVYRGQFEQRRKGVWGGRFGIWGIGRDYEVTGEEALAPQVDQRGLAFFALEEFQFERVKLEFGARVENQRYTPAFLDRDADVHHDEEEEEGEMHVEMEMDEDDDHDEDHGEEEHAAEPPETVQRAFTGMSASAGILVDTWNGGAFVGHFTRSYRAPALEELYNFGPHAGNVAFEIGDSTLKAETGVGLEGSLRHRQGAVRGEVNFFLYDFSNFIFPFSTGEEMDELQVIEFTQLDARYVGAEAELNVAMHDTTRLKVGMDFVDARSVETNTPLPRIPPLRGKFGLELSKGGFQLEPELVIAGAQNDTFVGETRTAGYAVVNLAASYTYARAHVAHQFSLRVFNMADRLYRNHSSFIKDLAPEIGRGLRVGYTLRFF